MDSIQLKDWVERQCREIGFGKGGREKFVGKDALKQKLISHHPKREMEIRQLVNAINFDHFTTRAPPKPLPQVTHIPAPPAQPKPIPKKPKQPEQSKSQKPQKAPPVTVVNIPRAKSRQSSDSGFISGQEDTNTSCGESSASASRSAAHARIHSPESVGGGAFLSTRSKGKERVEPLRSIVQTRSNLKILELPKSLDGADHPKSKKPAKASVDFVSTMSLQLELLHFASAPGESEESLSNNDLKNAVLFSGGVLEKSSQDDFPQYGLLAGIDRSYSKIASDSRVFLNTNIPFSAFICGVQGSGKSHTTACMIENCIIPSPALGVLLKPLSVLVFNFAEFTSSSSFRPCELSFLASPTSNPPHEGAKKVNVLVSPSNYISLKALYTQIPGVTVQPFMLRPEDLNIGTMLTLMSVDQTQSTPLYMGLVTKILRNMASESVGSFNYLDFRHRLESAGLDRKQEEFLNQRLDLLESFLDLDGSTSSPIFAAGEVTIIDLSCPFVDASTACVLFKIGMGLYLESDSSIGKVVVLDEAHKYMTDTPASKALTDSVMTVIRQQRHYGARVIISTQEPSISPKLIDLCSITVMHRFSSPEWLQVLQKHILLSDEAGEETNKLGLLRDIMRLRTGEALVFAPSAILGAWNDDAGWRSGGDALLRMRMRKRVTWDGGRSIVCI